MGEFEIRVKNAPKHRKPGPIMRFFETAAAQLKKIFMKPRAVAFMAITAGVVLIGTPHIGWEYQCRHAMSGPNTCRSYAWCGYYGIQGRRVIVPPHGYRCGAIKFLRPDWARLIGRG